MKKRLSFHIFDQGNILLGENVELFIKVTPKNNFAVVYVSGQLDSSNCVEVHDAIVEQVENDRINILLNFKQLSFLDSACLGMLVRSLEKVKEKGGSIVVVGNKFVQRVLSVTGLVYLFDLYTDEKEALDHLKNTAA